MSQLPDALQALGLAAGLTARQPQCSSTSTARCRTSSMIPTRPGPSPGRPRPYRSWARTMRSRYCPAATSPMWSSASAFPASGMPVLEQVAAQLRDQLGSVPGSVVEHKRFGVAVHYRNATRDRAGGVAAAVHAAGQRPGASGDDGPRSHRAASRHRLGQGENASLGDRSPARCPIRGRLGCRLGSPGTDLRARPPTRPQRIPPRRRQALPGRRRHRSRRPQCETPPGPVRCARSG